MDPGASLADEKTFVSQANSRRYIQRQHVPGLLERRHGAFTPGADAERSAGMNQRPDLRAVFPGNSAAVAHRKRRDETREHFVN